MKDMIKSGKYLMVCSLILHRKELLMVNRSKGKNCINNQ